MSYRPISSELDRDSRAIIENLREGEIDNTMKMEANKLALRLRSRLMDLATWKADNSPHYFDIEERCRTLTKMAGSFAHQVLVDDFDRDA